MSALSAAFDHPYLLILAIVASVPVFVGLAHLFFRDPDQVASDELEAQALNVVTGSNYSVIVLRFVAMAVVGGAFIASFYHLGSWVISWMQ